jgi:hypothetical protein
VESGLGTFLGIVGLGGFVLVLLYETVSPTAASVAFPTPELKAGCRGAANPALARQIAEKWVPVFGGTVEIMMVVARIESGYRAVCANYDVSALTRGGAAGMWQQTKATAIGHAAALANSSNPTIAATMQSWDGSLQCLTNPDLCGMFAAKQLAELGRMFPGNFAAIIGGYHQGAGKIRVVLASGGTLPDSLPPKGKAYVQKALAVRSTV